MRSIKTHPDWNPFSQKYDADVAILEIISPVQYSNYIIPACIWPLNDKNYNVIGKTAVVAGALLNELLSFEFIIIFKVGERMSEEKLIRNFLRKSTYR